MGTEGEPGHLLFLWLKKLDRKFGRWTSKSFDKGFGRFGKPKAGMILLGIALSSVGMTCMLYSYYILENPWIYVLSGGLMGGGLSVFVLGAIGKGFRDKGRPS